MTSCSQNKQSGCRMTLSPHRPCPISCCSSLPTCSSPKCVISKTTCCLFFSDYPPGSMLGQPGAALLRHTEAGDVSTGGDIQPPTCRLQTHDGDSRAGAERPGPSSVPSRILVDWSHCQAEVTLRLRSPSDHHVNSCPSHTSPLLISLHWD